MLYNENIFSTLWHLFPVVRIYKFLGLIIILLVSGRQILKCNIEVLACRNISMVSSESPYCSAKIRVNPEIKKISLISIEDIKMSFSLQTASQACIIYLQVMAFTTTLGKNTKAHLNMLKMRLLWDNYIFFNCMRKDFRDLIL